MLTIVGQVPFQDSLLIERIVKKIFVNISTCKINNESQITQTIHYCIGNLFNMIKSRVEILIEMSKKKNLRFWSFHDINVNFFTFSAEKSRRLIVFTNDHNVVSIFFECYFIDISDEVIDIVNKN